MSETQKIFPIKQEAQNEKEIITVPVSSIRRYEEQPRTEFDQGGLEALAESIKEYGLQQPITVVVLKDDKVHDYELKDGERRLRAHQIAGIEYIDVIVDYETKPGQQHLQSLISNFNRAGHTPIEISNALAKERENGVTAAALAVACGKSDVWVYQHLSLQNLHPDLQELMSERSSKKKLRLQSAYELSRIESPGKQLAIHAEVQKIKGGAQKIAYIKQASGREVIPRQKRPARDARNLQNFVERMDNGVERFAGMNQEEFKVMLSRLQTTEIDVLIDQLKGGAEALLELADFVKNLRPCETKKAA